MSVASSDIKLHSNRLLLALLVPMIVVFVIGAIVLHQYVPILIEKNITNDAISSPGQVVANYITLIFVAIGVSVSLVNGMDVQI